MRITVNMDEFSLIVTSLKSYLEKDVFVDETKNLLKKLDSELRKPIKTTKRNATKKAIEIKQGRVKEKIRNAVNLMNLQNQKININSVSKESGVAYNTVKKYKYLLYKI